MAGFPFPIPGDTSNTWGTALQSFFGQTTDLASGWVKEPFIDARVYATLAAADAAAVAAGKNLLIASNWTLVGNTTLASKVLVVAGGSFTKASTFTLTINGSFSAGLYQVFSGFSTGNVTFGIGSVTIVPEIWFGGNVATAQASLPNHNILLGTGSLHADVSADYNIAIGVGTLAVLTTKGADPFAGNIGIGDNVLPALTTGSGNIGIGKEVLQSLVSGDQNVAIGNYALQVTTSQASTAVGQNALAQNIANAVTAVGSAALFSNTTGINDAFGSAAALLTTTGTNNFAFGQSALHDNVTGDDNHAFGGGSNTHAAALQQTTGSRNTGVGGGAGYGIKGGNNNTAVGFGSLQTPGTQYVYDTGADQNTAVGYLAGTNYGVVTTTLDHCTFIGANTNAAVNALTNSTAIGNGAKISYSNQVQIGNNSVTRFSFGPNSITWVSTAPSTGTWAQGDRAFNSAATVGQPKGWICTVAGTPGTWVSEGNL